MRDMSADRISMIDGDRSRNLISQVTGDATVGRTWVSSQGQRRT
jgi:hypothetical protein